MIVWMIRLNREKDAELTIDGILIDFRVFRKNLNVLIFKRFWLCLFENVIKSQKVSLSLCDISESQVATSLHLQSHSQL